MLTTEPDYDIIVTELNAQFMKCPLLIINHHDRSNVKSVLLRKHPALEFYTTFGICHLATTLTTSLYTYK